MIPAHNEEDVIEQTVRRCLDQTVKPYEVIVVNDGSRDRTRSIVEGIRREDRRVRLVNFEKGHSAAFARNRGAEAARGDVIYFLDADMVVQDREFIKKIADVFGNESIGAVVVQGESEERTLLQKCQVVRSIMSNLLFKMRKAKIEYVSGIRRKLFKEVGGFNEKIFYYEDRELGDRVARRTKIPVINIKLMHMEPSTLSEVMRQARYVGKGVSSYNIIRENPLVLIYPAYPLFWLVFAVCILLSFLNGAFLYILALLVLILIIELLVAWYLSGMFFPSFCFVFFMSPLRAFLITYSFAMNMLKRR